MCEDRHIPSHAAIDHRLAEGVVQMVVAADHMGDAHVMIIDNNRQHVGWRSVGAQDDHVVKLLVLYRDGALYRILDGHGAVVGHLHAHSERGGGMVVAVPPG